MTDRSYGAGHKTWVLLLVQCTPVSTRVPTFRQFVLTVQYLYISMEQWSADADNGKWEVQNGVETIGRIKFSAMPPSL